MFIQIMTVLLLISAFSFVGVLVLGWKEERLQRLVSLLVPFAAGSLLGSAFIHLLPHAFGEQPALSVSTAVVAGFFFFFVLEKGLRWHHCHDIDCDEHVSQIGPLSLAADGLHNFIDGVVVGASFLESGSLGIATSLAVIAHELPQEIGDYAILIQAGYTRKKALWLNFLSSLSAILGGILVYFIGSSSGWFSFLIPFTAGGFVYISASGLIPQIQQENLSGKLVKQILGLAVGFGLMFVLALVG